MQNQTPTANLQALVPKLATRGQWFCTYPLRQTRTTINTNHTPSIYYKIPFATRIANPINSKIPVEETRSQEHHKGTGRNKQPVRTSPRLFSAALILCVSYHLHMMKQRLIRKNTKLKFFSNTTSQRPSYEEKGPIPPKKTTHGLVPKFAARCQLFRTYSPTPTNNNCMKQKLSNNSI